MNKIKTMALLEEDPEIDYKKRVLKFLEIKPEIIGNIKKHNRKTNILDLSSFMEAGDIEKRLDKFPEVILSPLTASKVAPEYGDGVYTAFPFRQWAIARRIADMSVKNICGDMTSIRILWSAPKKASSDKKSFLYSTVAGLVDLSNYMAGSELKLLHFEKVKNENNLFGLLTYQNNVAVELEINETLPKTMEASRFIRANFTDGILTNMPLVGYHNEEGSLFADDKKLTHPVVEDAQWDGFDEIENTYWQMLMAINGGTYPKGLLDSKIIINAINTAIKTEEPVSMENLK